MGIYATPPTTTATNPMDLNFELTKSRIMIVDDEPVNIKVVKKYLRDAGYQHFITTSDSQIALGKIRHEIPDLVLLDVMMPHVNGLEILEAMRWSEQLQCIPTLILTASSDAEMKLKALEHGAVDFLAKPVDPSELQLRVRNALIAKVHQNKLADYSRQLEHEVSLRTAELVSSREEVIRCLATAAECRDKETGNHVIRVGLYSGILARELGMDEYTASLIEQAAVLHDVGKIGIPDSILLKPGRLTAEEINIMRQHCEIGHRILTMKDDERIASGMRSPILKVAATIAMSHHEKWDGSGYPHGLTREHIPIEGRIAAVADVFDALSSTRAYKGAYDLEQCFIELIEGQETHFDPLVVHAFFNRRNEIVKVYEDYSDEPKTSFASHPARIDNQPVLVS
ncbi:MAG TPA: two-component system response regulator [Planctomycetaceae bacterium]|nr:two-component system response regulator [Blastopirellula sp.]HAY82309.1 two-component system response regulator [Planctomycetaceae bacterium]